LASIILDISPDDADFTTLLKTSNVFKILLVENPERPVVKAIPYTSQPVKAGC
jgi:hypothetical protein